MKYRNAAEILPDKLLRELQTYIEGDVLYVPKSSSKQEWGSASGSRSFYQERNEEIRSLYKKGHPIDALSKQYNLANNTIRKIVYG